jgi:hypothetical protein
VKAKTSPGFPFLSSPYLIFSGMVIVFLSPLLPQPDFQKSHASTSLFYQYLHPLQE